MSDLRRCQHCLTNYPALHRWQWSVDGQIYDGCQKCYDHGETKGGKQKDPRTTCLCGETGKHRAWAIPGLECDACALKRERDAGELVRNALKPVYLELCGDLDSVQTHEQASKTMVERVRALKAIKGDVEHVLRTDAEFGAPLGFEHDASELGCDLLQRLGEARNPLDEEGRRMLAEYQAEAARRQRCTAWGATSVGEAGPGLAASHKDTTPAQPLTTELVLSIDDGRWDE